MFDVRPLPGPEAVAASAADDAVRVLSRAIARHGSATWVLAGGTSPLAAYRHLVAHHAESLDWSAVTVVMGDERMVPLDSPDSNWGCVLSLLRQAPGLAA